ncbi:MAG: tyrosine-type recombinase/integrase [Lachnospiraceae bacterium]|nr:tyrosine-type recombinase/integrase [Lachnospiraceae bacterium]
MSVRIRKDRDGRVLPQGVSQRADGRYMYRYSYLGKNRYIYDRDLTCLKKKIKEAEDKMMFAKDPQADQISLNEYFVHYMESVKKRQLADVTYTHYYQNYEWYIEDGVGKMKLREIRNSDLIEYIQQEADKHNMTKQTVQGICSQLANCFGQAVKDGILYINPAFGVAGRISCRPSKEKIALKVEEVELMLNWVRDDPYFQIYYPLLFVALYTGMRWGELSGLTWEDIDFEYGIISINHAMNYRDRGKGHEFYATRCKTEKSIRTIRMIPEIEERFREQKKYQNLMSIRQDVVIDGYKGFIFTTKQGLPFTNEGIVATINRIIRKANVWEAERAEKENRKAVVIPRHTPHIWRHTFCTRLVEQGVRPEIIKEIMGHKKIQTSLDVYNHLSAKNIHIEDFTNAMASILPKGVKVDNEEERMTNVVDLTQYLTQKNDIKGAPKKGNAVDRFLENP